MAFYLQWIDGISPQSTDVSKVKTSIHFRKAVMKGNERQTGQCLY